MSYHPNPNDDEVPGSNKRRKVNTCLQCKARKVKCDKVRPLCGPCQRRRVPADRCVFADEADPETLQHYLGPDYLAQEGYDVSDLQPQASAQAASLLGLHDPQARAVLDRITRELRQNEAAGVGLNGGLNPVNGNGVAAAAAAAAAVAAGGGNLDPTLAGTLLANTTGAASNGASTSKAGESAGSLESAILFPFASESSHERTKFILGLLPNDHVVNVLLDGLRTFESKSPLGISWRLIRIQLINLRGDISDWRTGQVEEPDVDLSFLALLFELMVSAIDCKPVEEVISEGIALTPEQVPEMTDRWHATCQALLAMSNFVHEPNLNTVCTEFLFYLYELRRGKSKIALNHLQSSFQRAKFICMHQLSSAQDDASRWASTSEGDDVTIRTGAVTAMRKAVFEGGEAFAVSEEQSLLDSIRSHANASESANIRRRDLLQTNIPDRTHLVREAARMLFVSITWHLELVTPPSPLAEPIDDSSWTTELISIDEAHLPDGESPSLPSGPTLGSISTHFFQFLSASTRFLLRHKSYNGEVAVGGADLLGLISDWNGIAETHLARMREQVGEGRAMLNQFSLLIHHFTRLRLLRPYFGQLEESHSLAASRATLIDSCKEALLQVQKITATTDVDLSIFSTVVTAVKVDATLILALHLLIRANYNDSNSSPEWVEVRDLTKSCLQLLWNSDMEAAQHRLSESKPWRKQMRQVIEEILQAAFERKRVALEEQPRIKNEDGELPEKKGLDEADKVENGIGGLQEEVGLKVYRDELLKRGEGEEGLKLGLFFDALDGYLRSL